MRIIHTSDWHLGQNFMGKSRAAEHKAFLEWLLQQIDAQQVDAVIVAGDIFDTGSPPSYAREIYNRFVVEMQQRACPLIVLGGNHDSVAMLEESRELLACLNTRVIPSVMQNPQDQIVVLNDKQGLPGAIVCAIPYIRPRDVVLSQAGQSGRDKQREMQQAIAEHYATVFDLAQKQHKAICQQAGVEKLPIIATGHLTTVGASTSDSVREIYIGTLDAFPASAFPPADYIALGHIHQSQKVAKSEHIRYSGSPIPLSFDETGRAQGKSVLQVDFAKGKLAEVTPLQAPEFQSMQLIKGNLDSIELALQGFADTHQKEEAAAVTWLDILVEAEDYLGDLPQRLAKMAEELPVEILRVRRARKQHQSRINVAASETLHELDVTEVFERRLQEESWDTEEQQARAQRLKQHFQTVLEQVESDTEAEGGCA